MLSLFGDLELERARQLRSWTEVMKLYPGQWVPIPRDKGRMSFSVLESDQRSSRPIGRCLALVAMEDARAPEEAWASGSLIFGIHGFLNGVNDGSGMMGPGEIAYLGGTRHAPFAEGLYVGLWGIPEGDLLQKMADRNSR